MNVTVNYTPERVVYDPPWPLGEGVTALEALQWRAGLLSELTGYEVTVETGYKPETFCVTVTPPGEQTVSISTKYDSIWVLMCGMAALSACIGDIDTVALHTYLWQPKDNIWVPQETHS